MPFYLQILVAQQKVNEEQQTRTTENEQLMEDLTQWVDDLEGANEQLNVSDNSL